MNTKHSSRIGRRTAQQLLDRASAGTGNGHPSLTAVLNAAGAPGRTEELASEHAVVTAFQAAGVHPVPQPGRISVIKTAVAKVLTVKILAIVATTTAGGVALAASTGALPNPLAKPAPSASAGLSAADRDANKSDAAHRAEASKGPKGAEDAEGAKASHAPSPSLVGLCHAFSAGNKADQGKALESPAFTALITAAGGKEKVEPMCQTLLASPNAANEATSASEAPDKAHPSDHPTEHAKPTASPKH